MTEAESPKPKRRHPLSRSWWTSFGGIVAAITTVAASIVTIVVSVPPIMAALHPMPQPKPSELQRTPDLALEFWSGVSGGTQYPMSLRDTRDSPQIVDVQAKAEPFIIRFPTLNPSDWGGVHICAWKDPTIFNVQAGKTWSDINYDSPFVSGKGLADTAAGHASLPLTNEYHSYWVDSRVDHVSQTKDQIYISSLDDKSIANRTQELYLTIWIDQNQDDTINNGEYEYVVMHFTR